MRIQILTIFPRICESVLRESILKRAQETGLAFLEAEDLRAWATNKHRTTDDAPYGGAPGMVMKIEPIARALDARRGEGTRVLLMSPQGRRFDQKLVKTIWHSRRRPIPPVAPLIVRFLGTLSVLGSFSIRRPPLESFFRRPSVSTQWDDTQPPLTRNTKPFCNKLV